MERFELHIEAESRIRWKVYVRFGGEFSKTDHSNMTRRRLLSLHYKVTPSGELQLVNSISYARDSHSIVEEYTYYGTKR